MNLLRSSNDLFRPESPRHRSASAKAAFVLMAASLCGGLVAVAQQPASHIDSKISGYWELHPDSLNVPPASLTAAAITRRPDIYKKTQFARRWCNAFGMPTEMESYRPVNIVVGDKEVVMPSEFTTTPRHIYLGRSKHANPDIYEPNPVGDSLGKWDGDDLLVDTNGFSERGVLQLPGGGFRTKNSVLEERYHSMNDGKNLLATFTWYDSDVFAKPYTYALLYYRVPQSEGHIPYSAGEMICDSGQDQPGRDAAILAEPTPVPLPDSPK